MVLVDRMIMKLTLVFPLLSEDGEQDVGQFKAPFRGVICMENRTQVALVGGDVGVDRRDDESAPLVGIIGLRAVVSAFVSAESSLPAGHSSLQPEQGH